MRFIITQHYEPALIEINPLSELIRRRIAASSPASAMNEGQISNTPSAHD
jgi:hypothetical protein